ncbi:MAG: hypothetical protein VX210_05175 [Myxococcota bacterium]|nr:hypothetical protein [Myxococcota bacterium]
MKTVALLVALNLSVASADSAIAESEASPSPATSSKVDTSDSVESSAEGQATPTTPPPSTWDRQQKNPQTPPEHEGVTMGMQALKTLFGLGIVLALLFLSSRLVSKKLGSVRWKSKAGRLQVSDFMLLDGKSGVYLVEIDGADWVVVTGPHGTSLAPKDSSKRAFNLQSAASPGGSSSALDLDSASLIESDQGEPS